MTTRDELAGRETLFREVNENIASLTGLLTETDHQLFICECSNTACAESLELTPDEYEAVRAHPTRFVVKPGHHRPESSVWSRTTAASSSSRRSAAPQTSPKPTTLATVMSALRAPEARTGPARRRS